VNKTSPNNRASRAKITLLADFANKAGAKIASSCRTLVGFACWHLFLKLVEQLQPFARQL
jgi:hypothetical protein